jgi:thiol-disulfide isomerase/thioredoxin
MQKICLLLCFPLLFGACIAADKSYTRVAPGIWRGVLELEHFSLPAKKKKDVAIVYDQFKRGELPFNFEVKYVSEEQFYVEIFNGSTKIRLDSIQYGRDRTQARDTMNIWFPEYQSYLHAEIRGGVMQGYWKVTTKENYQIPFYAHSGRDYRFTTMNTTPLKDISGEWVTLFGIDGKAEDQEKTIGEFKQKGNHLEGTFRTETGDYGFLEGIVLGRKFWLSSFDGAHAFLFAGSMQGDSLQGEFLSGTHHKALWTAWRDPNFKLSDESERTKTKSGGKVAFAVKTPEGKDLVFPSATWCPNCRDEQVFLTEFVKENPALAEKMSIVGFAFERNKTPEVANAHLSAYKKKLGIPFDIVYAGAANKDAAAAFFPALDHVMAFPTMMILDKNNQVVKIYTGFDGPATSKYTAFKTEFAQIMQELSAK